MRTLWRPLAIYLQSYPTITSRHRLLRPMRTLWRPLAIYLQSVPSPLSYFTSPVSVN
jgi:hypothetical protein